MGISWCRHWFRFVILIQNIDLVNHLCSIEVVTACGVAAVHGFVVMNYMHNNRDVEHRLDFAAVFPGAGLGRTQASFQTVAETLAFPNYGFDFGHCKLAVIIKQEKVIVFSCVK